MAGTRAGTREPMAGHTDGDAYGGVNSGAYGHRALPHTADLRIEAWGASREQCLGEAVRGLVESFADLSAARVRTVRRVRLAERTDDELLAALLDEVVFRLEVHGELPVYAELEPADAEPSPHAAGETTVRGVDVRLAMTAVDDVPQTGAAPKAVSWHELRLTQGPLGWSCAATVDV